MANIHAVLYHTPNCQKCKLTLKQLSKGMRVKVEYLFDGNDEWSERKIDKFREQGYASFPVVRIYSDDTGERLDDWCDLQVGNIQRWVKAAQEESV